MSAPHFLLLSAVLGLASCSTFPSPIDDSFGASVRLMTDSQLANPQAPVITAEQPLIDGQSARAAVDRYQKSFEVQRPAANVYNIGVGSGASGSAR